MTSNEIFRRLMDSGIIPLTAIFLGSYSIIRNKFKKLEDRIKKLEDKI